MPWGAKRDTRFSPKKICFLFNDTESETVTTQHQTFTACSFNNLERDSADKTVRGDSEPLQTGGSHGTLNGVTEKNHARGPSSAVI